MRLSHSAKEGKHLPRNENGSKIIMAATKKTEKKINPGLQKMIEMNKASATFHSGDELLNSFENYLSEAEDQFKQKPPSFSRFADFLGVSRYSVYYALDKYPKAEAACRRLLADMLVENAMLGTYRDAVAIFTLKNVAGWTDKRETTNTNRGPKTIATADEARENVKLIKESLGFDDRGRPSAEAKRKMEDMEDRIIRLAEAKAE